MSQRNIVVLLAVIVVVIAGFLYITRSGSESPGQPSPHALDQSN